MSKKYVDESELLSIPFYEKPQAISAISELWQRNGHGKNPQESSLVVHGQRADGSPVLVPQKDQHETDHETFNIGAGDTDIVHTHPNDRQHDPSAADMQIAKDHAGLGMYVMGSDGLYRYAKGMKAPELVQRGSDASKWDTVQAADRRPDVAALPAARPVLGSALPTPEPSLRNPYQETAQETAPAELQQVKLPKK